MDRRKRSDFLAIRPLVAGLLLAAAALSLQRPATNPKGKSMSILYEAKVQQTRWMSGETVVLDLRIDNRGSAPIELPDPQYRSSPQPHFQVTAPGRRQQEFRPDSRATDWDRAQPKSLLHIAPGGHWEADFELTGYVDLTAPGHYTLRSWIEYQGSRIESPVAEFEILGVATLSLAAETSLGDGSTVVECVELLQGGQVASSMLQEADPRNAELLPFTRVERGSIDPDATAILAPFSNFSVGLSALRWMVAAKKNHLIVGHNLHDSRVTAFGGAELSPILSPVATQAGLYLSGMEGSDLLLTRITGSEKSLDAGRVWTVEQLKANPVAAALTLSPQAAGNTLLFVLAWPAGPATQVRFLTVSPLGKVIARADHTVPGLLPSGPAAAGWSTTGELRASLVVHQGSETRVVEFRLRPDLSLESEPVPSQPAPLTSPLQDARIAYFESRPGLLGRMVLLRAGGQVSMITATGAPAAPRAPVPATGPLAILPGRIAWYAVWPGKTTLSIARL